MNKREKIIVVLAIISLLYGVYSFVLKKSYNKNNAKSIDITRIKENIWSKIKIAKLSSQDKIILYYLKHNTKDPFLYLKPKEKDNFLDVHLKDVHFEYNGFIYVDNKKFAIINGREYVEGEPLEVKGFKLISIFKDKVILKGPGEKDYLTVPLIDKIKTK